MTNNETARFGVTQDGQTVVEPFARDTVPHCITIGQSRAGRTYNTRPQRIVEMFDGDGCGDEDRDVVVIDPDDGEMTKIEDLDGLESINPLDVEPVHDENEESNQ